MNSSSKYNTSNELLLVGDNAFQGVNHLSQDNARVRVEAITDPSYCASLVLSSIENGANGFMFSVNDYMLSILRSIKNKKTDSALSLHAIVPSAVDYVRLSGQTGMEGLVKRFSKQLIVSGNPHTMYSCLWGVTRKDIPSLLRGLLSLEINQIESAAGKNARLDSVLMHELLTDIGLALDLRWLFESFIKTINSKKLKVGFETRNFCLFVKKCQEWNIDIQNLLIVTPFNSVGFQMNPNKERCEEVLRQLHSANVIAINILASGYLRIQDASLYIKALPNTKGVAVGVSKEAHARETFQYLRNNL